MHDRLKKNKITIISEIHPQHHGSMDELKRMVLQSKIGGADYVKVQLYSSKKLFNNNDRKYVELTKEELKEIANYSRKIGIETIASVFDEERIKWCEDLKFKLYKIASLTIKNKQLCKKIISTNKPVIASLGMYNFRKKGTPFKSKNVSYLYCISKYPTNLSEVKMPDFKKSFFTGYSDHTVGIGTCLHAVSRGAKIIEKHFTLNKAINCETEKAHVCSMNFEDLKALRENADILSILNS
tara:strand:- start:13 stop:732 length:720 start_codon:yes stop_codon:yes gene_type:complete